jgi:hypothetical protein
MVTFDLSDSSATKGRFNPVSLLAELHQGAEPDLGPVRESGCTAEFLDVHSEPVAAEPGYPATSAFLPLATKQRTSLGVRLVPVTGVLRSGTWRNAVSIVQSIERDPGQEPRG